MIRVPDFHIYMYVCMSACLPVSERASEFAYICRFLSAMYGLCFIRPASHSVARSPVRPTALCISGCLYIGMSQWHPAAEKAPWMSRPIQDESAQVTRSAKQLDASLRRDRGATSSSNSWNSLTRLGMRIPMRCCDFGQPKNI